MRFQSSAALPASPILNPWLMPATPKLSKLKDWGFFHENADQAGWIATRLSL